MGKWTPAPEWGRTGTYLFGPSPILENKVERAVRVQYGILASMIGSPATRPRSFAIANDPAAQALMEYLVSGGPGGDGWMRQHLRVNLQVQFDWPELSWQLIERGLLPPSILGQPIEMLYPWVQEPPPPGYAAGAWFFGDFELRQFHPGSDEWAAIQKFVASHGPGAVGMTDQDAKQAFGQRNALLSVAVEFTFAEGVDLSSLLRTGCT